MSIVIREQSIIEAIQKELDADAQLIVKGLENIQSLSIEKDDYFFASQSLSQGLERMMKVILYLSVELNTGDLREKYGHNLNMLWDKIRELYESKPIGDKTLNKELKILSEFNKQSRYYYLNILDGVDNKFNPQKEWEKLESKYLHDNAIDYKTLANGDTAEAVIKQINRSHIISLEKLIVCLSKIIVACQIAEVGWSVPIVFQEFAKYDAGRFGKTDYTTWPQSLVYKDTPHKITWIEIVFALILHFIGCGYYMSKVVKKKDFKGVWPFRELKKVRVIRKGRKDKALHLISIEGYLCALDGKTSAVLHLPTPHKAGYAVGGYSTQPFLDLAMKL